jgi:hypothetical protein
MPTPHEDAIRMIDERDAEIAQLREQLRTYELSAADQKTIVTQHAEITRLRDELRIAKAEVKEQADVERFYDKWFEYLNVCKTTKEEAD